jgi:hypothetical protein
VWELTEIQVEEDVKIPPQSRIPSAASNSVG